MWFVAIVADLFLVFDEISKFDSDSCDNHQVAPIVRSRTKTDQEDVPMFNHEKSRSVVITRGPLTFYSLFLLDH